MNIEEGKLLINYAAERAHRRHLPAGIGFGLLLAYQEKVEEAADYIAANYPKKISGFPILHAVSKASDKPAREVADDIIAAKATWIKQSAKIEGFRVGALTHLIETNADIDSIVEHAISHIDKL